MPNHTSQNVPTHCGEITSRRTARRWLWTLAILALMVAAGFKLTDWFGSRRHEVPPAQDPNALPELSSSPFLNTRANAAYVGSETCRPCHARHEISFRRTGMGRSMAEVDLAREPPDGAVEHRDSKRRYEVRRQHGRLWHRELLAVSGAEVLLAEFPLKYVVGSGRHSLTYLAEADGFLIESPVTWYTSKQAWAMSPGYDGPDQPGFSRTVGEGCLTCHAGRTENVAGNPQQVRIKESHISCERCHGPGSLHVARRRDKSDSGKSDSDDAIDHTIVNPAHLSRELAEAVCQQCHLQSDSQAWARGRDEAGFRPGLPLQEFRHDYQFDSPDPLMTVVGHVEQLHLSRCYQGSTTLTCITCHDPHGAASNAKRPSQAQAACRSCHQPERCRVAKARRDEESPENNCIHCHMPRTPTDIPHLAFTHHRIAVHAKSPEAKERNLSEPGALKPVLDLSRLSGVERTRSLGMAYLVLGMKQRSSERAAPYLRQAITEFQSVRSAGMRDPAVEASWEVARFLLLKLPPENPRALTHPGVPAADRSGALFVVAYNEVLHGSQQTARTTLRELTRLRRDPTDWLLLAGCEQALGDSAAAIAALEQAVCINPKLWQARQHLAEHYRQQGNRERAAWHQRRAEP